MLAGTAIAFGIVPHVQAGLSLHPVRQEVVISPGGKFSGTFYVKNTYEYPIQVTVQVKDWFVLPENKEFKIEDWISLSIMELDLERDEEKPVNYELHIPTAARGVLVGMVSFASHSKEGGAIQMKLSGSVYAIVQGTEKIGLEIMDIDFSTIRGKPVINVIIKNNGNVHLRPQGTLNIYKKRKSICELPFDYGRPVYPGNTHRYEVFLHTCSLEPGKYKAQVVLKDDLWKLSKKKKFKFNVTEDHKIEIQ
jgi:hypothetical protein